MLTLHVELIQFDAQTVCTAPLLETGTLTCGMRRTLYYGDVTAPPCGGTTNLGGGTLTSGGGTQFRPVPAEFNHSFYITRTQ